MIKSLGAAGSLLLLTLAVYIPATRAGFVWDDDRLITDNPLIQARNGLPRIWLDTRSANFYPLTQSAFWLEWRLWGQNPKAFHIVNVLFQGLNAVLIWLVLGRLRVPAAWLAALIFAVHPVAVESVAWVSELSNLLGLFFYALAVLLYLRFEDRPCWTWYWLAWATLLLALLSKTSSVTMPPVLLLLAWWRRGSIGRRDVWRAIPFFALSLVLGLVEVWFHNRNALPDSIAVSAWPVRLAGAGQIFWFYLSKVLVPYPLMIIYPPWTIGASLISFLPALALAGSFALFWRFRRTWGRPCLLGLGYFGIALFPVLGFFAMAYVSYPVVADHLQYMAIPGAIALAVAAGARIWERLWPGRIIVPVVLVAGVLSAATWQRQQVYEDQETLWRNLLERYPDSWFAHAGLGAAMVEKRDFVGAVEHFSEAVRIRPNNPQLQNDYGFALVILRRFKEAEFRFRAALRLKPQYADAAYNLAMTLALQGKFAEAASGFSEVLRIRPDFRDARERLAQVQEMQAKANSTEPMK